MSLSKRVGLLGAAAALALSGGSFADTTSQATNEELLARVAELEQRLAAVEAGEGEQWLTEQRANEIRSLVQDVLADADTRASLLAQGMTAGYQDGAVISSPDGNWVLHTNLHMQQRFVLNSQDETGVAGGDESVWGFENTRTKFILTGNVVSPEWFYKAEIEVASNNVTVADDDRLGLGDAYIGYDYGNGWKVMLGTMKAPLLREELIDSRYQLAVERSLVNYLFTGGRTDGIAVDYLGDQLHFMGMYSNGINDGLYGGDVVTGGTAATASDTDYAFTLRGEWLAMGNWDQFMDFTSPQGSETGVVVGGAVHYQESEDSSAAITPLELLVLTADAQVEFGGGNLFGAIMWAQAEDTTIDQNPLGVILQGGYYFTEDWEGYLRFEWSDLDTAAQDISIVTFGVNKYFSSHNAKWTTDIGVAFDEVATDVQVTGFREDAAGADAQFVIRSQLQIVF